MKEAASILEQFPDYEVTIGMEVHVQLTTQSKLFCNSSNGIPDKPNVHICQICTGQPGVLPVLNKQVVISAVKAGLALHCDIQARSIFARKHYFYPDLPKNYQITQNEFPICLNGYIPIRLQDGSIKKVRLMRIHIEEDAGKNIHSSLGHESFVDFNRAGTPLLEVVSQPDLTSAYEVREYLKHLRLIVQYLGIGTGNMEEGAFRADTNISMRKKGATEFGTRCELKNINSFKYISDAIEYEIERQITTLEAGKRVSQETRLWDTKEGVTKVMRSKEEAVDYRYLTDPDLPSIDIDKDFIGAIRAQMPELPFEKANRYVQEGLSEYEADVLINDLSITEFYEKARALTKSKQLINWILRDLLGVLKHEKISLSECKITPIMLAKLMDMLDAGTINNRAAQEIFADMAAHGHDPQSIMEKKGLQQMGDTKELETILHQLLEANPEKATELKEGRDRLRGFFVGEAMKKTQGKGNPQIINTILDSLLKK